MSFFMTEIFPILFFAMFFLFFGIAIFTIIRGLAQWNRNNHAPRLTVTATVVAKRYAVNRRHRAGDEAVTFTNTTYYATFQVESGDRMELLVPGSEFGMLVEGDRGQLSFQGTRFLSFQRQ